MRVLKTILKVLLIVVILAGLAGLGMLALSKTAPKDYAPLEFSAAQQDTVTQDFFREFFDFNNQAGSGKPFEWTLTQEEANSYLTYMDAIGKFAPKPVKPVAAMQEAGFSDPMLIMRDGYMTLMIFSTRYDRVLSVDVTPTIDSGGFFSVQVRQVRVGLLPVPRMFWADKLAEVRRQFSGHLAKAEKLTGGQLPVDRLATLLRAVVESMDGQAVRPEIIAPVGKHRVLVDSLRMELGKMTLHCIREDRK